MLTDRRTLPSQDRADEPVAVRAYTADDVLRDVNARSPCRISRRRLNRMISLGVVPGGQKLGGRCLIDPDIWDDMVKANDWGWRYAAINATTHDEQSRRRAREKSPEIVQISKRRATTRSGAPAGMRPVPIPSESAPACSSLTCDTTLEQPNTRETNASLARRIETNARSSTATTSPRTPNAASAMHASRESTP